MIVDLPRDADVAILADAARELGIGLLSPAAGQEVRARDIGPVLRVKGVRLALNGGEHYRAYRHGRRINAVSWEGHRDWMRLVFAKYPETVIRTMLDTWAGSDDFEARHAASEPVDGGTPMNPAPSGGYPSAGYGFPSADGARWTPELADADGDED